MGKPREELDPATVQGVKYLRMVFRLFDRLAASGCERDLGSGRRMARLTITANESEPIR